MSTEKNLSNLVINKVESQAVYDYMKSKNLINSDELYFVSGADEVATGTTDGLMSAEDKIKLDGIEEGAEANVIVGVQKNGADLTINSSTRKVNIIVPTKTSDLTNDSNFATTTDLDAKVDKVTGKGLSANDYTTEEKTKLSNIENGANKTIIDTALSSTSTNPVQNKVINTKLSTMQSDIDNKADEAHIHSELVNGNASVVLNMSSDVYDLSPQYITTYMPEVSGYAFSYLGTSDNKWDWVYAKNINLNGTDLQSALNSKVPSSRTVNGKALTANITLSASDVGALPSSTVIPSINGLATETYVDNKVAGLVDSAPAALDTLNELAAALGDDPNFATTVATQIGTKVDKVEGKGLSTNDYTTEEKTKLASLDGANYVAKSGDTMSGPLTVGGTTIKLGASAEIVGTTKQDTIITNQLLLQKGAVFGGTALEAGLVTRGICGIYTPDNNGACQKENLYINYDGDSSYRENRQVILQAGSIGAHYGNNLYQYAAARGDAVKGWVQAQGFATTTSLNGKVDKVDGKGLSTNDYTTAEKTKLSGIASGAEVNVQSDWNETDTTSDAYILNKPIAQNVTLMTISEYTADEIQVLWDSIFV